MDKPVAALISDLKQRGLLDDTLIICGGEFGRTPFREGRHRPDAKLLGRDHYPDCFSMWLAGGGIKPGTSYGESDELGFSVGRDKVHVHDLQATNDPQTAWKGRVWTGLPCSRRRSQPTRCHKSSTSRASLTTRGHRGLPE